MTTMPALWRTSGGAVVHIEGCPALRRANRGMPWEWSRGKTSAEIRARMKDLRITSCGSCRPLSVRL